MAIHKPHQVAIIEEIGLRPQSSRVVGLSRDGRMAILENALGYLSLMPVEFLIPEEMETLREFRNLKLVRGL